MPSRTRCRIASRLAGRDEVITLVGEIHRRLEARRQIEQLPVERADGPRERALELIERHARLQRRDGVHEVRHRFRLHEIEAAVQERAKRELARLGKPRAGGDGRAHDLAQQRQAAVGADLDDVLGGVGMRSRESTWRRLRRSPRGTRRPARADSRLSMARDSGIRAFGGVSCRPPNVRHRRVAGLEIVRHGQNRAGHCVRARAADAHHANPGAHGRGGNGHDRVGGGEHGSDYTLGREGSRRAGESDRSGWTPRRGR